MAKTDVLVVGAGPFGLSISTHLRSRGVEHMIVGRTMDTWRNHMPLGLFLKSEPYSSSISAAAKGFDIPTYCAEHGYDDYIPRVGPLSLERFLGYAEWFASELVPGVEDVTVTSVTPTGDGFKVELAEESPLFARQVIVATGLIPYKFIPSELSGLPSDLMTHSSEHARLDLFSGKRVAVLGGGQSSLQTAALLSEQGADVQVIVRKRQVIWERQIAPEVGLLDRIRRPPVNLCEGWACVAYGSPGIFRRVPESFRVRKALTTFGPTGAWWLRDRVDGVLDVLTGTRLTSAEPHGSGLRLHLDGSRQSTMDVDHLIAGTGFRIDVSRLPFMSEELLAALKTHASFPAVNRASESSVPGLYFAGAHTMTSLGPGVRFIAGTQNTSAQLARSVARRAGKGPRSAGQAAPEPSAQPLAGTSKPGPAR